MLLLFFIISYLENFSKIFILTLHNIYISKIFMKKRLYSIFWIFTTLLWICNFCSAWSLTFECPSDYSYLWFIPLPLGDSILWDNYVYSFQLSWFTLDFDYDSDAEFISWINFIWEYKYHELENFIQNIKYDEFAIFENIGCPDNLPYYDDCPHKIIAYPLGDKCRFIVVACEDYDNDEYILTDILVQPDILIDNLEKSFQFMKNKYIEIKHKI